MLLTLSLLLLTPSNLYSQDKLSNLLTITYGSLAGADITMTAACSSKETCKEANPLLAPLVNNGYYGLAGGIKAGIDTTTIVLIYKYTEPRSKKRYIALTAATTIKFLVVAWNAKQIHGK